MITIHFGKVDDLAIQAASTFVIVRYSLGKCILAYSHRLFLRRFDPFRPSIFGMVELLKLVIVPVSESDQGIPDLGLDLRFLFPLLIPRNCLSIDIRRGCGFPRT